MLACVALARSCQGRGGEPEPAATAAATAATDVVVTTTTGRDEGTVDSTAPPTTDGPVTGAGQLLADALVGDDARVPESDPAHPEPDPTAGLDPDELDVFPDPPARDADSTTVATWLATMVLSADADGEAPHTALEPFLTPELALEYALAGSRLGAESEPPGPVRWVESASATTTRLSRPEDTRIVVSAVVHEWLTDGSTASEVATVEVRMAEADGIWTAFRIEVS